MPGKWSSVLLIETLRNKPWSPGPAGASGPIGSLVSHERHVGAHRWIVEWLSSRQLLIGLPPLIRLTVRVLSYVQLWSLCRSLMFSDGCANRHTMIFYIHKGSMISRHRYLSVGWLESVIDLTGTMPSTPSVSVVCSRCSQVRYLGPLIDYPFSSR